MTRCNFIFSQYLTSRWSVFDFRASHSTSSFESMRVHTLSSFPPSHQFTACISLFRCMSNFPSSRCLFVMHYILSSTKISFLKSGSKQLGLSGIIKTGYPGVLLLSSSSNLVDDLQIVLGAKLNQSSQMGGSEEVDEMAKKVKVSSRRLYSILLNSLLRWQTSFWTWYSLTLLSLKRTGTPVADLQSSFSRENSFFHFANLGFQSSVLIALSGMLSGYEFQYFKAWFNSSGRDEIGHWGLEGCRRQRKEDVTNPWG